MSQIGLRLLPLHFATPQSRLCRRNDVGGAGETRPGLAGASQGLGVAAADARAGQLAEQQVRSEQSTKTLSDSRAQVAESGPFLFAHCGAAGRRRVRGKDCVHLEVSEKLLFR
jgi:hypothetical protein